MAGALKAKMLDSTWVTVGGPGVGVPTGGTTAQVLTKNSATNFDTAWTTPSGGGASLTALNSALLGVKVWSTGSSAYVWSGTGSAPDSNSYTNIVFVDPAGTHDPTTSTGGRSVANDLWETGASGSGGSGSTGAGALLAKTVYNPATQASPTTTSTTYADVDTANLAVTFTAPTSGNVIVSLSAVAVCANNSAYGWCVRSAGANVAGTVSDNVIYNGTTTINVRATHRALVTGLTASTSYTYTWAHARSFGTSAGIGMIYGGTGAGGTAGPAVMEVWSA